MCVGKTCVARYWIAPLQKTMGWVPLLYLTTMCVGKTCVAWYSIAPPQKTMGWVPLLCLTTMCVGKTCVAQYWIAPPLIKELYPYIVSRIALWYLDEYGSLTFDDYGGALKNIASKA
jgi:hypothetical protein